MTELITWISCAERLPEEDQLVLCWNPDVGMYLGMLDGEVFGDGSPMWNSVNLVTGRGEIELYGLEYKEEEPTHWMPVPDSPTGYKPEAS